MRALPILLLAVALSSSGSAVAANLKPWVGVGGSLGRYSMGDVNRDLEDLNAELKGTPLHLWPIGVGPGCGMSAGVDIGPSFSFGIGYDRVFASSGAADSMDGYLQVRLPANAFRGMVEYAFPRRGRLGARLGVAVGKLMVTGQMVGDSAFEVRGGAPYYEAYLGGDWWGQPRCGLVATVGYRYARVNEVKIAGQVERNPDGSKYRLDYSGALLRLGLKIPLTAPAGAPAPTAGGGVKPWVGLNGSWGGYKMTDLNHDIEIERMAYAGLKQIHGGPGFGGSVGVDFPGRLTLGVGYDRLTASSKASNTGGSIEYRLPANAFRGLLEYRLPPRGHFGTRLGIAGGAVMEANPASRYQGSGALLEAYGSGEWRATSRIAATASLGYRYAKAGELKQGGALPFKTIKQGAEYVPSTLPYTADYSGIIARAGLKVALTK